MRYGGLEIILTLVVVVAAWHDIRTRHIPNWIPVSGALLGVVFQIWHSGLQGGLTSIFGAALGLGIFLPLYMLGGMGAGDVKLFGAVGALVGPASLIIVFVFTGLLGGLAAGILAAWKGRLRHTLQQTGELMLDAGKMQWEHARAVTAAAGADALRLPYGAVIAAGALLSLVVRH
jgi:prepilin peptidase CpaA